MALFPHAFVFATSEEELRAQIAVKNKAIEQLEQEIKQYQAGIQGTAATAKNLQAEIKVLNQEVAALNKQITLTKTKIDKKNLEIKDLSNDITDTTEVLVSQEAAIAESLRKLQEIETQSVFEIFLKYPSVSSFFDAIEQNKALESSIADTYKKLTETREHLQNQKVVTEKNKKQLINLQENLTDQKSVQEDTKLERNQLLKVTKNQEAAYQKLLRDREARRASIAKEIQDIEFALQKLIDTGSLPARGSHVLSWPVEKPFVTQEFGQTAFSKSTDVYKGNGHNGIDLRAAVGATVMAAADGVVKGTGDTDRICPRGSYGKWVVIEHDNNLSTLYAHLSKIRVAAGTKVSQGDIIGLAGNTGYTTGPHVHFTVYASNTFRQTQTKYCGLVPAGGYLNPIDYL
jgi:murein DD-endopeptidase MepM/ murein hydrolase activator NlpD